jgi:putative membrane protein
MLYLMALHIIFVVTWFSGLFYIVRLFVYHSEANLKPEAERKILFEHFRIAERRLWYGITWPSAIGTYIFGISLLVNMYGTNIPSWLYLKLVFVLCLTIYHLICGRIFRRYQKDEIKYSDMKMRLWNEVATIFLVAIVFIVVMKDLTNWMRGFFGLLIFTGLLFIGIRVYKKVR